MNRLKIKTGSPKLNLRSTDLALCLGCRIKPNCQFIDKLSITARASSQVIRRYPFQGNCLYLAWFGLVWQPWIEYQVHIIVLKCLLPRPTICGVHTLNVLLFVFESSHCFHHKIPNINIKLDSKQTLKLNKIKDTPFVNGYILHECQLIWCLAIFIIAKCSLCERCSFSILICLMNISNWAYKTRKTCIYIKRMAHR